MLSWNTCSKHKLINSVLCKSLLCYIVTGFECYIFTPSYKEIKHVSILMSSLFVVHTEFSKYLIHNNWNKAHMFAVKKIEKKLKSVVVYQIEFQTHMKINLFCIVLFGMCYSMLVLYSCLAFVKTCIRTVQPRQNNTPC